ncbi:MAG: DUF2127 domain-containing protein [Rhodocyclaceae bacterium]|nr:DUF2127 domain-containing protein [Rhodocyclaceae bacterium]
MSGSRTVRTIALVEAAKGLVVVLAASGLLSLVHADLHALAARLVAHTHLNPASRYPRIFLDAASQLQNSNLMLLALGAAAYAALRFIEAYGLYRERAWAELLAAVSGAIYVPFEVLRLMREPDALGVALLAINLAVVAVMVHALRQRRRTARGSGKKS